MKPDRHDQIKKVFLEVCELPETERAAHLERICEGDTELKKEVERLLELDLEDDLVTSRNVAGGMTKASHSLGLESEPAYIDTTHRPPPTWHRKLSIKMLLVAASIALGLGVCLGLRSRFRDHLLQVRSEELRTVLEVTAKSVRVWIEEHLEDTRAWAQTPELLGATRTLANYDPARPADLEQLVQSPLHATLREFLRPASAVEGAFGFEVYNKDSYVLSSATHSVVGQRIRTGWGLQTDWMFRGNLLFVTPVRDYSAFEGHDELRSTRAVGFLAPIIDESGVVIGSLSRGWLAQSFFELLATGRFGLTGDTYAFDESGVMISESRFNEELRLLDLVSEADGSMSSLVVALRDPGRELEPERSPASGLANAPLTRPALLATIEHDPKNPMGRSGVISKPYRNYLGREVVGAWQWIPEYGMSFGLVTEIEVTEALQPLLLLDASAATLFGIFLTATGIGVFTLRKRRLPSLAGSDEAGRYKVVKKIGEGGLGDVYLVEHVFLKRPAAVKLLKSEVTNTESIRRFEREVQLASRLTHPNTIQIFDYGLTSRGQFYYVMEYLDGLNLSEVVSAAGGPLPVARVVAILRQVCEALQEAHHLGLVHRDIKPMNIMLCQRGGRYDVVKVLDFGLIKKLESQQTSEVTAPHHVSGTLMYMAPERFRNPKEVDVRTDIYSVGAVGYFLLSGRSPFGKTTDLDILYRVVNEPPTPLPEVTAVPIPSELNQLIWSCLAKSRDQRPANVEAVLSLLGSMTIAETWGQEEAHAWWERMGR